MFEFEAAALEGATATYHKVQMEPAQGALLRDLAALVGPVLGMDPIPCFGFWLQAVRAWQVEHEMPAEALASLPPAERAQAAMRIREHFGHIVGSQLRDSNDVERLEGVLDDAFQMYLQKYNAR
ncbi:MAG: hypothetical protein RLO52_09305 [Sandaracinaceae bacterium]|nr:hypothetical protein [Myxococcales bacterium]